MQQVIFDRSVLWALVCKALGSDLDAEQSGLSFERFDDALEDLDSVCDPLLLNNICMRTLHTTNVEYRTALEARAVLLARADASATEDALLRGVVKHSSNGRLYFLANLHLKEIVIEHHEEILTDCHHGGYRFWLVKPPAIV